MAFPTNPTNGQQATVNGVIYTYSTTTGAWLVTTNTGSNISGVNLSMSGSGTFGTTVVASGNVTGSYFIGNGSALTGLSTSSISSGTSSVAVIASGGNALINIGGVTNSTFSSSGLAVATSLAIGNTTASGNVGEVRATGAITAFYSDKRLKENITVIENALDKVDRLTGVLYTQNKLAEQYGYFDYSQQVGLLAQDVQQAQPEAVKPAPFDIAEDGSSRSGENYLTVQYDKLVPLLVEAIKELRLEIKQLKGE